MERNHTHVRKVGHTSKFRFGIYWWTLKNPKNQTFEKMKKTVGDIIILHICTKNHNHMRYSSWDTEWDITFCHFRPFFALLTPSPSNNPKNQNFEKMKKASGDVIVLNLSNKKHYHMMYAYSDMECDRWPSSQGAGFPIQGSRVQNHWVAPRSTQPFILPRSVK